MTLIVKLSPMTQSTVQDRVDNLFGDPATVEYGIVGLTLFEQECPVLISLFAPDSLKQGSVRSFASAWA